jgi:hypothetical protein
MAHYAKLDENNIVIDVIVIANKNCLDENGNECEEPGRCFCEALSHHGKWKKTSYNTRRGIYYNMGLENPQPTEDQSKAYRINFAENGMKYDEQLDGFVVTNEFLPKRHPQMVLNPQTGFWALPRPNIPCPEDLELDTYPLDEYYEPWFWDINVQQWIKVKLDEPPGLHRFTKAEMI